MAATLTTSSPVIGKVTSAEGIVRARTADGSERILQEGAAVHANEVIVTGANGAVAIELLDGSLLTLGRNSELALDTEVFDPEKFAQEEEEAADEPTEVASDVEAMQLALLAGEDPSELEATAAGGDGAGNNEGSSFVILQTGQVGQVDPTNLNTTGLGGIPAGSSSNELVDGFPDARPDLAVLEESLALPRDENGLRARNADVLDGAEGNLKSRFSVDGEGDGHGDDFQPVTVTGNILANDDFDIDGPGGIISISHPTAGIVGPGGTLFGPDVFSSVGGDGGEGGPQNLGPLWSLSLDPNGDYEFTLNFAYDHGEPGSDADERVFEVFSYTITDRDGDVDTTQLAIEIVDDQPSIGDVFEGEGSDPLAADHQDGRLVDEDALPQGNGDDNPFGYVSGYLDFSYGADGPGGLTFGQSNIAALELLGLESHGEALQYEIVNGGRTLVAFTGELPEEPAGEGGLNIQRLTKELQADTVFEANLYPDGRYDFNLLGPLDHPVADSEDEIPVNLAFTVMDGDGDTVSDAFSVRIEDDVPKSVGGVEGVPYSESDMAGFSLFWDYQDDGNGSWQVGFTAGAEGGFFQFEGMPADSGSIVNFGTFGPHAPGSETGLFGSGFANDWYFNLIGDFYPDPENFSENMSLIDAFGAFGNLGISYGADGPKEDEQLGDSDPKPNFSLGDITFTDGETGGLLPQTSGGGNPITTTQTWSGTVLTVLGAAGDVGVYELVIDTVSGDWTFTQTGPIDHPDAGLEGAETGANDPVNITFDYTIYDFDMDSFSDSFTVQSKDDGPVIGEAEGSTLSERALDTDLSVGTGDEPTPPVRALIALPEEVDGGEGDGDPEPQTGVSVTGSLAIDMGEDVLGSVAISGFCVVPPVIPPYVPGDNLVGTSDNWSWAEAPLTSKGEPVVLGGWTPNETDGGGSADAVAGDRTVFTVSVTQNDDGGYDYTFELFDQLDHVSPVNTDLAHDHDNHDGDGQIAGIWYNYLDSLGLEFSFTATDADGDSASSSFVVTVEDDAPVIGDPEWQPLHEKFLDTLDVDGEGSTGTRSDSKNDPIAVGSLGINGGADDDVTVSFTGVAHGRWLGRGLGHAEVKSKGEDVEFSLSNGAIVGMAGNREVLRATLGQSEDGEWQYTVELKDQIDHQGDAVNPGSVSENNPAGNVPIRFEYQVTDFDGDTATKKFTVGVRDDAPVIEDTDMVTVDESYLDTPNTFEFFNPGVQSATVAGFPIELDSFEDADRGNFLLRGLFEAGGIGGSEGTLRDSDDDPTDFSEVNPEFLGEILEHLGAVGGSGDLGIINVGADEELQSVQFDPNLHGKDSGLRSQGESVYFLLLPPFLAGEGHVLLGVAPVFADPGDFDAPFSILGDGGEGNQLGDGGEGNDSVPQPEISDLIVGVRLVLAAQINEGETYDVALFDQLDHPDVNDPNDVLTVGLDFVATDYDGQTGAGTITLKVHDDGPVLVECKEGDSHVVAYALPDDAPRSLERQVSTGERGDKAHGTFMDNVDFGADEPGRLEAIRFNGTTIEFEGDADRLTIDVGAWKLTAWRDGSYKFGQSSTDGARNTFPAEFVGVVSDADGDSVEVPLSFAMLNVPDGNVGTAAPDFILGDRGDDIIRGRAGDDFLYGEGGADLIHGNAGNDYIEGGKGDDTIHGGLGHDTIRGGKGGDTIHGGAGCDDIEGGKQADTIYGGADNDSIDGGKGNDHLHGGAGNDTIDGGEGNDHIRGNAGDDSIDGGEGNDHLHGGAGNDDIAGGEGSDVINGGAGNDVLSGGESVADWDLLDFFLTGPDVLSFDVIIDRDDSADVFVFDRSARSDHDVITDFEPGNDVLDLADLLRGEQREDDLTSYLQFENDNGDLLISVDFNGTQDGGDFTETSTIRLENLSTNDVSDILSNLVSDQNQQID